MIWPAEDRHVRSYPTRHVRSYADNVNGAHLVALVRAGGKFEKGVLVERPEQAATEVAA